MKYFSPILKGSMHSDIEPEIDLRHWSAKQQKHTENSSFREISEMLLYCKGFFCVKRSFENHNFMNGEREEASTTDEKKTHKLTARCCT